MLVRVRGEEARGSMTVRFDKLSCPKVEFFSGEFSGELGSGIVDEFDITRSLVRSKAAVQEVGLVAILVASTYFADRVPVNRSRPTLGRGMSTRQHHGSVHQRPFRDNITVCSPNSKSGD